MKTLENIENILGSETFVKDALLSKTGLTLTLSTVAFGVLAGSQLLFGWVFGEQNKNTKKKKSLKEKLTEEKLTKETVTIGGIEYNKVSDNRYERI